MAAAKEWLAPNTFAGYADCLERDLIPVFGYYHLPDLRDHDCAAFDRVLPSGDSLDHVR
ncbi:hypothetical protein ACGF12_28710 [Kitasatospora sp. NPDC048296]|uniref:hypothetical protein n=1 Tax=Kitasatospora sp. NPDC048296 TaxID=3364048 RepID=UPI00371D5133